MNSCYAQARVRGLTLLLTLPLMAYAADEELDIKIYPGTGKVDIFMDEFRAATQPLLRRKESWPDVMDRYTVKRNSAGSAKIVNIKTQDDVTIALERNRYPGSRVLILTQATTRIEGLASPPM